MRKRNRTAHRVPRLGHTGAMIDLSPATAARHRRPPLAAAVLALAALTLVACAQREIRAQQAPAEAPPLQVVAPIELQRYMGLWYEQARLPNRFQRDCTGQVSARYGLRQDGRVDVLNRCATADGSVKEALGEGRTVPVKGLPDAGQLEVRFAPAWLSWLPLVWGDYWILRLEPDYSVALVGTPDRKYLWLLSREPRLAPGRVSEMLEHARASGFDVSQVVLTPADPPLPRD